MPPKKKSCEKKTDYRFKVNGRDFQSKPSLKGKTGYIRYRLCQNGTYEKLKPELWTDVANKLWDEINKRGLPMVRNFKLDISEIDMKTSEKEPTPEPVKQPEPVKNPESIKEPTPEPVKQPEPVKEQEPVKEPTPEPEMKQETKKQIKPKKKKIKRTKKRNVNTTCQEFLARLKENIEEIDLDTIEYQKLLDCIETKNKTDIQDSENQYNSLYPHLDDVHFTKKISNKKEFRDVKIEEKKREEIENIEKESDKLCDPNLPFELASHQMFVRNFLSFETPYNGLLLFHGLGTGKTCSSISVCEDMRTYNQQLGINKKIIIVASPLVQKNYKLQLFDKNRLQLINGLWNLKACTGNKFLKEVNPMNMKGLSKQRVVRQIERIIRQSYDFMGYTEFANKINKLVQKTTRGQGDKDKKHKRKVNAIKREFSNTLLVIDEVHNIRNTENEKRLRRTTQNMLDLVKYAENMKILLLTATPMFNDAKEIIWLINLLNLNDKRFPVEINDIFDSNNQLLRDSDGNEIGKELLIRKLIGYVSYVSGENPFTFPYRIWPEYYNNPHSLRKLQSEGWRYPLRQINGLEVERPINYLDLVILPLEEEQDRMYNYIIEKTKEKYPILNEPRTGIQYTVIDGPQQALNMVYPHDELDGGDVDSKGLYGKTGLGRLMFYDKNKKKKFKYSQKTLDNFGRIFSSLGDNPPLKRYSAKIYSIINSIKKSEGIVLVYSNFIDGGCVPVALALEEMGITRYGSSDKSLFETRPTENYIIPGTEMPGKYMMITGDKNLSPNFKEELAACTSNQNTNGEIIKVVIISKAGSEGLDFKNIRQVHILEPWFNLNRADQIIGRGVRNKSHCLLPFNKRNVQIFLYGSQLINSEIEPIDLYVYRLAEYKSIQIGRVSRVLKENAVDCLLNHSQNDMIETRLNKKVDLVLSTGNKINFSLGHKNNSIICDFMDCDYSCKPSDEYESKENKDSYSRNYIVMNLEKILKRIKMLFKEHYVYNKQELINRINAIKSYSRAQINMALDVLINDKNEYLTDMLGRTGRLVNINDFYLFQPIEVDGKYISSLERRRPLDVKMHKITFKLPENLEIKQETKRDKNKLISLYETYQLATVKQENSRNKSWVESCSWAISNLVTYNNLEKTLLEKFALEHLFDTLHINDKLEILNELIIDSRLPETFKHTLNEIINKYIIEVDGVKGVVFADYKKEWQSKTSKFSWYVFVYNEEERKWKNDKNKLPMLLGKILTELRINKEDLNEELIGFLTVNSKKNFVFKTKSVKTGKKEKGIECPSKGENRNTTLQRINYLARFIDDKGIDKYYMKDNSKKQKDKIYNTGTIKQYHPNDNYTLIPFTDYQLCVETEFLLRYLDENRENDKRWFFSTIEDSINNIKEIYK